MTGSKSLHVRPGRLAISRTLESRAPLERGRRQKTIVCPTLRPRLSSLLLCAPAHIANRLATRPTLGPDYYWAYWIIIGYWIVIGLLDCNWPTGLLLGLLDCNWPTGLLL